MQLKNDSTVEVIEVVKGCTSIGSLYFPFSSAFTRRLCYSFSREQRHLASPCFSLTIMFNRSEELEIHGPSTNRLKSWCISMKLVSQVQWPTTWFTPSWTRTQTFWDVQEDSQSGRQPWRQLESNKNRRRSRIATSQSSKCNRESHYRLSRAKSGEERQATNKRH